jgi:hypothetical protein
MAVAGLAAGGVPFCTAGSADRAAAEMRDVDWTELHHFAATMRLTNPAAQAVANRTGSDAACATITGRAAAARKDLLGMAQRTPNEAPRVGSDPRREPRSEGTMTGKARPQRARPTRFVANCLDQRGAANWQPNFGFDTIRTANQLVCWLALLCLFEIPFNV